MSVPENTSFHATLNHQHHNQQGIPQSPQQQPPNNQYQGMQVEFLFLKSNSNHFYRKVTSSPSYICIM